ncbi:undecaprenyl-diphosphate phosphatase [Mesosutterella sp. OilRF-GAM-744-9]|uniref:Undecaprenyl-diphosphatase n=1 Tax=Mesosutterella porci TaxID=2915351 RepID=A0ABS9MPM5_9BURK|nr:undecaprenyl-diphosphate phosphatase [Mesosutterella sp. oilRF-744-WT-GAM-9]MCG5030304.1 undecaprenyl-diphosphate phosphatase [Mesosutterella sp. oilRF-744-WT-GAM-9]
MDVFYLFQVAMMGIVEGLTEFLPISSTGHLIVAAGVLGFRPPDKDTFIVSIQAGAILAVCWHYRSRILLVLENLFRPGIQRNLAVNTVVAFLPAALAGVLLAGFIQSRLFNPVTVASALVVGGIIILWVENRIERLGIQPRVAAMDDMAWRDALKVGCMQCFALIPGMSRSGATIIGGMLCGLSRQAATEFSFFLAIPTIFGATVYDLWKSRADLVEVNLPGLSIGFAVSFLSALVVVKWLLRFVAHNNFRGFGWYRIVFGLVVLGYCAFLP